MLPPLDYYMEKTGKKPDEVSILEREAILLMTEYMRDELKERIYTDNTRDSLFKIKI